jgi:hypothetical protein
LGRIFEAAPLGARENDDDETLAKWLKGFKDLLQPKFPQESKNVHDLADAMEFCLAHLAEDDKEFSELLPKPLKGYCFNCHQCQYQFKNVESMSDRLAQKYMVKLTSPEVSTVMQKKWRETKCSFNIRCPKCNTQVKVNHLFLCAKIIGNYFATPLTFLSCRSGKPKFQGHRL